MKNIVKGAEPLALTQYAAAHPHNSWEQFRDKKPRRNAVQQKLLVDQGGLCAYCEIDLKPANGNAKADLRVEHFHPKSDQTAGHNWHLDWQNLLAVCHGGSRPDIVDAAQRHTSPNHSCDVPKEDNDWDAIILNPLQLPASPGIFRFDRSNGAMQVDQHKCQIATVDIAKAQATINNLQLDSPRLRNLRKPILDKLNQQLRSMVQSGLPLHEARQRLARAILTKCPNQQWPAFFSAIRHYLGEAAEHQLQAIGYRG